MSYNFARTASLLIIALGITACAGNGSPRSLEPVAQTEIPASVEAEYADALAAMQAGNDDFALRALETFIERHPGFAGAHVNVSIVQARNGRDAEALASAMTALEIDPGFAPAHNQAGVLLRREGRFDAAESHYLQAIEFQPGYATAHYNLGVLYDLYRRDAEGALEQFERYRALVDPSAELDGTRQVDRWIADLRRRSGTTAPKAAFVGEEP